jgi:dienelactone hydrolase
MQARIRLIAAGLVLLATRCDAVEVYSDFPGSIRANESYVIYSHGLIVEGTDPAPRHPEFGVYDFPAIKRALSDGGRFNLIAPQRPKNADAAAYVGTLESWVHRLLDAGVKPGRITLVGFSRGGQLTAYASARLGSVGLNTALLAVCHDGDIAHEPPLALGGRVLSIYETSDRAGPCTRLAARSLRASFEEIAISTGKAHGAFYRPDPRWIEPLESWMMESGN